MTTCIIGAGCSGFTTAKRLKERGLPFDIYEKSDRIGGNWAYQNPNGMSACYQSLHIDTSKWRLAFEDFPVPADWPDFPHHSLMDGYFNAYVDHFGLRELIRFNTGVDTCEQRSDGRWDVTLSTGETKIYDTVVVANGHHWSPNTPEFPGSFDGEQIHAHAYRTPFDPIDMRGKTVVVVGLGNSAVDIASELSQRPIAKKLFVSARRGVWVMPKYFNGAPSDKSLLPPWLPGWAKRKLAAWAIKRSIGAMEDYGLPAPDHKPLEAHPTVSGEFLVRCGSGDITARPIITELMGRQVKFADGSVEDVDAIVYATGYKMRFPFLADADAPVRDNHLPLFKRLVQPDPRLHSLWFMGLAQSLPTLVNLAEQQSKLLAAWLEGRYALPSPDEMRAAIAADEKLHRGHYYASSRHTMQVDFDVYVRDLLRELRAGAGRVEKRAA